MRAWLRHLLLSVPLLGAGCTGTPEQGAVAGLWQNVPVGDANMNVVARPQYVFTNRPLTVKTRFTGLQDLGGKLNVVCCVEVSKLKPLRLVDIVGKYSADPDFVEHMRSIQGLDFIYEATVVPKAEQNKSMRTIMATQQPGDLSPYTVPVIAASIEGKATLEPTFHMDGRTYRLRTTYPGNKDTMHVRIDVGGETIRFSEGTFPH